MQQQEESSRVNFQMETDKNMKELNEKMKEINTLTAEVEALKIQQKKEVEDDNLLAMQLQHEIQELKSKYEKEALNKQDCQDELQAINTKIGDFDQAQKEIERLKSIINQKDKEAAQINAFQQKEYEKSETAKKGIFANMFTPRRSDKETSNVPKLPIPTVPPRSSIRPSRSILKPHTLDEVLGSSDTINTKPIPGTLTNRPAQSPLTEGQAGTAGFHFPNDNKYGNNKMSVEIPILDTTSPEKIELFLDVFISITNLFRPDDIRKLIINTLVKNSLTELIPFLTEQDLTSAERFADFIRQSFSTDEFVLRKQYQELRQRDLYLNYFM